MAVVKAPAGNVNATIAGVTFVDGVAETSDTWALAYFARAGYVIDEVALPGSLDWSESKDPETMTVAELRDYAAAESIDLTGLTRKDEILAAILNPGAPTSVSATAGIEEIEVAWTAPSDTGPGAISGYEIEILDLDTEDAEPAVVGAVSSPHTIDGLEAGTEYRVRVRAVNEHGTGPWSAPDTATPTAE